jgi:riboflavin biosynthesis pyrimidine reductase
VQVFWECGGTLAAPAISSGVIHKVLSPWLSLTGYTHATLCLQVFWECGGTLAAPAISSGVIHKVLAFIAPKIIGGERAPTPVGELGNVEMTQAVTLLEPTWKQVRGSTGYSCGAACSLCRHSRAHSAAGGVLPLVSVV